MGWTTEPSIKEKGKDSIKEEKNSGGCYCATVRKAKRIDVRVDSYIPNGGVNVIYTQRGLDDVVEHERKRQQVDRLGYAAYFENAQESGSFVTRCGTICRKEKGQAKQLLQNYLSSLRSDMNSQFSTYWGKEQNKIGEENGKWRPHVTKIITVGVFKKRQITVELIDGYAWKYKIKSPSAAKLPKCPKNK